MCFIWEGEKKGWLASMLTITWPICHFHMTSYNVSSQKNGHSNFTLESLNSGHGKSTVQLTKEIIMQLHHDTDSFDIILTSYVDCFSND